MAALDPRPDFRKSAVGICKQCDWVDGGFIDPLFHLQLAGRAFRTTDLGGGLLHGADQPPTDSE